MATVVIDTNVLVGLLDDQDKWHDVAVALRDELNKAQVELVYPSTSSGQVSTV